MIIICMLYTIILKNVVLIIVKIMTLFDLLLHDTVSAIIRVAAEDKIQQVLFAAIGLMDSILTATRRAKLPRLCNCHFITRPFPFLDTFFDVIPNIKIMIQLDSLTLLILHTVQICCCTYVRSSCCYFN